MTQADDPNRDPTRGELFRPQAEARGAGAETPVLDAERIVGFGMELGLCRVGISPVARLPLAEQRTRTWLAAGHHGSMGYLDAPRRSPAELLRGARSVVVCAISYGAASTAEDAGVAAYARGADYHGVLKQRLRALAQRISDALGAPLSARVCVDTAPLLERAWAERAGLGFIGKSSMLIVPGAGSAVLLGELLVDRELPVTRAPASSGCGSCTRCLDACPTGAFVDAYTLDARRCISYLTIEHQGDIPVELRAKIGSHLFGCDICQRVCPFNWSKKAAPADVELAPRAGLSELDALFVLGISSGDYRRLVKQSALSRASRAQLQRNAAVVLGNSRRPEALEPLAQALASSRYPSVRGHAAWALAELACRLGDDAARAFAQRSLSSARTREDVATAQAEIELAAARLAEPRSEVTG